MVLSFDHPAAAATVSPRVFLGTVVDEMQKAGKGGQGVMGTNPSSGKGGSFGQFEGFRVTARREITVGGFPGYDLDIRPNVGSGFALGRMVLVNNKLIFLFTGHDTDAGYASQPFLDSLRITGAPPRP